MSVPPHAISDNNGILIALYTQYSDSVMSARSVVLTSMGASFSLHVQKGSEAQPTSCTVGTELVFGGKAATP